MSEAEAVTDEEPGIARDLTAFQQNILVILSEEAMYGLAIKRELEEFYGAEVNHGRLYPNLDDLVELGLVEKSELDKRTNQYALTEKGHEAVLDTLEWTLSRYVTDESRADEVREIVDEQN
ncbi:PadR family transcriptional regulator [Halolamina sediminis]|jgi:DNA-binding PadR family transcriptional regulator|uniref:PadR family transcriptional regulator n=1 Tax=Halolamina sediminis TaxID=1480675 RepID=UPI0006B619DD|nr:PadR family transcriptional regulator [Halolamina sediminis]